ncbi:MAG: DUF4214 domain-containing protein [Ramlibacter sp.]
MVDHEKLIQDLYMGFFHRTPAAGELKAWVTRLQTGLGLNELVETFVQSSEFKRLCGTAAPLFAPPGHFYSPIVSPAEVQPLFDAAKSSPIAAPSAVKIDRSHQLATWQALAPHLRKV